MLFSSLTFLIYFLPVFFGIYYLLPGRWKNGFLLISSLVFYGFSEPVYILLIVLESMAGFFSGLLMDRLRHRRLILIISILMYAGIFVYFKYTGFLLQNLAALFGTEAPVWKVLLPLGISFYTFQILSYTVDVYRQQVAVQRSLVSFMAYVCMFPQLIAGPIVRYSSIDAQLQHRTVSFTEIRKGILRFICGLSKKVLLANQLYAFCEGFRAAGQSSVLYCWLNALCILLYTYFDFSGYSDMAIGLGQMMGFTFPENFNYPLTACSVTAFWRRWHMSLTTWFKDYVYIPLGGSRVPTARHIWNLLVVWLFTGLWHGASWTFVVWGLFFFAVLVFEKFILRTDKISHVYVWVILLLSFLLFSDPTLSQFAADIKNLFGLGGLPLINAESLYAGRNSLVLILICLLGSFPWPHRAWNTWTERIRWRWFSDFAAILCWILCLAYITGGSFNPFLYFRF